jgi:hypothetical protein
VMLRFGEVARNGMVLVVAQHSLAKPASKDPRMSACRTYSSCLAGLVRAARCPLTKTLTMKTQYGKASWTFAC